MVSKVKPKALRSRDERVMMALVNCCDYELLMSVVKLLRRAPEAEGIVATLEQYAGVRK